MDKSHRFAALIFVLLFLIVFVPFVSGISGRSVSELRMQSSYNYIGWIIIGVIALIVIAFVFIRFKPIDVGIESVKRFKHLYRPKTKKEELMDYIDYKLGMGENRLTVRKELLSVGWPEHLVNEAFREAENSASRKVKKKFKRE